MKSKSNERECALPNDPTLDTMEVKKIDEAMANLSPASGLRDADNKKELPSTKLKLKKRAP